MEAVASWSGGKDSCLALHLARRQGHDVKAVLNILSKATGRSAFQEIPKALIARQAKAMGLPLIQSEYAALRDPQLCDLQGRALLRELRGKMTLEGYISGHINPEDAQRRQLQGQCADSGVTLIEPLSGMERKKIVDLFFKEGFEAVVIKVNTEVLDERWLGKPFDAAFIAFLEKAGTIDLCGDFGEYHTLVVDGPLFKRRIDWRAGRKTRTGNQCHLNLR